MFKHSCNNKSPSSRILNLSFEVHARSAIKWAYLFPYNRLTHVQVQSTWNFFPIRPSKFLFEYLLPSPRSAPIAISSAQASVSNAYVRLSLTEKMFHNLAINTVYA